MISVIRLLASIVIVALNSARQKARSVRVTADFAQIAKGIEKDTNHDFLMTYRGCWEAGIPYRKLAFLIFDEFLKICYDIYINC